MARESESRRVAVVMAGGSGERFWPLSRPDRPKQLLPLTHPSDTMLAEAVQRVLPLIPAGRVYIATAAALAPLMRQAALGIPDENVLGEPCKRNTAGCLAFATAHLLARYGEAARDMTMAVLTADQMIGDAEAFRTTVRTAMEAAESENALAIIGIVPTRPETGYGYIHLDLDRAALPRYREGDVPVYAVAGFDEKPDRARAEAFVQSGRSLWNAGMFFWRISVFLAELERALPEIAEATYAVAGALRAGDGTTVRRVFEGLHNISIDRALMERTGNVVVARGTFPWDDMGTWAALDRARGHDAAGNVLVGEPVAIDCRNSVIYNAAGERMAVSVVGMNDVVVVVTEDAVLVTPKDRAQDVRQAVAALQQRRK